MSKHRNPQARLSKQAPSDNFDPGVAIERLYRELGELLGNPHLVASPDAVAPDRRVAYDGAPMLTSSCRATGGAS